MSEIDPREEARWSAMHRLYENTVPEPPQNTFYGDNIRMTKMVSGDPVLIAVTILVLLVAPVIALWVLSR